MKPDSYRNLILLGKGQLYPTGTFSSRCNTWEYAEATIAVEIDNFATTLRRTIEQDAFEDIDHLQSPILVTTH